MMLGNAHLVVSIRAPARGAIGAMAATNREGLFQSALPHEERSASAG